MTTTADLFGTPLLPGLGATDAFIDAAQERALIAAIDGAPLTPFRFQQWTGKRLTHSFGWHYDFESGVLRPGDAIPVWLTDVIAAAERFAGLPAGALVQVLVTRYDAGAGIGWHRDRPDFDHVVGISLGAAATMRFRRRDGQRFERRTLPLVPRGAYHLAGAARHDWEHSIAPVAAPRWSITLRSLRGVAAKRCD
jgi:alkylated DNA repair dioxygenase AlkB